MRKGREAKATKGGSPPKTRLGLTFRKPILPATNPTKTKRTYRSMSAVEPKSDWGVKTIEAEDILSFIHISKKKLRKWVEANSERVNTYTFDHKGYTPLFSIISMESLSLTLWLVDEKGADVNKRTWNGYTPLHAVRSLDILNTLLDRGADPTVPDNAGYTPLLHHAVICKIHIMARLLDYPRVRATVDKQDSSSPFLRRPRIPKRFQS